MTDRPYRLAIVGSRHFPDLGAVRAFVQGVHAQDPTVEIVSGGAVGVDLGAQIEAQRLGMTVRVFLPLWRGPDGRGDYNPRAGFERNQTIVEYADEIVAFWDGISRGTQDAIRRAEAARKPFAVRR